MRGIRWRFGDGEGGVWLTGSYNWERVAFRVKQPSKKQTDKKDDGDIHRRLFDIVHHLPELPMVSSLVT